MASLEQLVYKIPKSGMNLSKLHALARQKRAATGRYGRTTTGVSTYHGEGVGDFAAAPIQNITSGGAPKPALPTMPAPAPAVPAITAPSTGDTGEPSIIGTPQTVDEAISIEMGNRMGQALFGGKATKGGLSLAAATAAKVPSEFLPQIALNTMALNPASFVSPANIAIQGMINAAEAAEEGEVAAAVEGEELGDLAKLGSFYAKAPTVTSGLANIAKGQQTASSLGHAVAGKGMASKGQLDPFAQPESMEAALRLYLKEKEAVMPRSLTEYQEPVKPAQMPFQPMTIAPPTSDVSAQKGFAPMTIGTPTTTAGDPSGSGGFDTMGFDFGGGTTPGDPSGGGGFDPMGIDMGAAEAALGEGGGDGGDGTVICTELHRQGLRMKCIRQIQYSGQVSVITH
jgi:hypothetical protein